MFHSIPHYLFVHNKGKKLNHPLQLPSQSSSQKKLQKMPIGSNTSTINQLDQYNGKLTSLLILSCMMASVGGVIFGYDVGISGGVTSMEPFLVKFFPSLLAKMKNATESDYYCKFESQLLIAFMSSLYIVGMFASIIAAPVTQKYGRRMTMMTGSAAYFGGALVGGAAASVWMLVLSRVLLGVGVGFVNQAVPIYIAEMALPNHRGAFISLFRLSHHLGFLLASLINFVVRNVKSDHGWRLSLTLASIPASLLMLAAFFLPETPTFLLQCGGQNLQPVIGTLQRIRGTINILTELNDIVSAVSNASGPSYRKLSQRRYRPQLIMAMSISFLSHMARFHLMSFYAPTLLQRSLGPLEDSTATLLSAMLLGLTSLCANIVAVAMIDRLGRRPLFMIGSALMLTAVVMIARVMTGTLGDTRYFLFVMICLYVVGFELSWGILGVLIPSEIFPLEIRSAGQSIAMVVSFMYGFATVQTFHRMNCVLRASIFYFVAVWIFVVCVFVCCMMPETMKLPVEKMKMVWKDHWFWKRLTLNIDGGNGGPHH